MSAENPNTEITNAEITNAENPPAAPLLVDGWRMAVGTLTAVPVRPPSRIDRRVAGAAMLLAPVAALPVAAVWIVCAVVASAALLPLVLSVVAVAGMCLATRAMHLDGLADTADGLSASYDRDRALQVMKTGDVGPSGAAAIALVLLLQVTAGEALFVLAPAALARVVVLGLLAVCASRYSLALACMRGVPSARPGGLGATVAGSVSRPAAAGAGLFLAVVGALGLAAAGGPWWGAPLIVLTPVVATALLVRRCVTRLGGITGDVLGAAVEISCACALTVAAAVVTGQLLPLP
ncbi:adenosylcobinamide-GDP ribazoletransferase [Mobilicoccus pelagius]|uniref:Adenosylcobinamide-GDP ribazoletransferase n=1 Tax=Mobilicoccus pelagius NBRC 104925 TaxID=1089455 RepID=H5UQ59_9MICO|nr:adenosylcobinamide-GDP ribazoletransferase [Mobilicoccus pelagius]GAB47864.1 cobalamin synthase [Mobilicoccus pelagius NBRC 104925]